jgi:IclR family mhp operon transcriptional activator
MQEYGTGVKKNRSLIRGLQVLTEISLNGPLSATQIARGVNLPRATVVRLIDTLLSVGMIQRYSGSKMYQVAEQVSRLSHGYDRWSALTDAAINAIDETADTLTWPLVLTTPAGLDMVVRYNTDHKSPLAIQRYNIGYRVPIFDTASGIIFLAYGLENHKTSYLELLKTERGTLDVGRVERLVQDAFLNGYCIHHRAGSLEKAFAIPIRSRGVFCGSLTMRFIPSAIGSQDITGKYLSPLIMLSSIISDNLIL